MQLIPKQASQKKVFRAVGTPKSHATARKLNKRHIKKMWNWISASWHEQVKWDFWVFFWLGSVRYVSGSR